MLACHDCDALFQPKAPEEGERIVCPHCGATLASHRRNALQRATAFAAAAAALFFVANFFPFLSVEVMGRTNTIGLAASVSALKENDNPALAVLVAIFILGAPAAMVSGMLYVLIPLLSEKRLPGAESVCRILYGTDHWNMIEVFLIGVLVSLLKLAELATVKIDTAFWAFAGLILCLTASMAAIDRREVWARLQEAKA